MMLIATRDLTYLSDDGDVTAVLVRLFAPEGSDKHWWCRYSIDWPDGVQAGSGHGVDQFQAIHLTLQIIGSQIYFSDYHETGRLSFEKLGTGYGFPVPKNARDLLVGEDKRFDGDG